MRVLKKTDRPEQKVFGLNESLDLSFIRFRSDFK